MKYPKINSLWKREEERKGQAKCKLIPGQYSLDEFGMIKQWQVQEKIDGTNIRIHFFLKIEGDVTHYYSEKPIIEFHGRTDEAQIPPHLLKYLMSYFTFDLLSKSFDVYKNPDITLYGEGYGPKIQSGGNYRKEVGFILFDIKVGSWWLKQKDVQQIARELSIPYAPIIGTMSEEEIVAYVKSNPQSLCSETPQTMEGVIVRTDPLLLLRNGDRLMWKLKCKDFKE